MLLRCCVNPGEMISGMDIRRRLWDRFGIIVGGSQFEMQILQTTGMILQIEFKSAIKEDTTIHDAYVQITIPEFQEVHR